MFRRRGQFGKVTPSSFRFGTFFIVYSVILLARRNILVTRAGLVRIVPHAYFGFLFTTVPVINLISICVSLTDELGVKL